MSNPDVARAMLKMRADALAIGRRVIERTAKDAADDLQKRLSVPAASRANASFTISSAPGEFPRKRSGRLAASVFHRVVQDAVTKLYFEVGVTAPHSKFLEKGTSRMAARPHLAPTREKWRAILLQRLRAAYAQ